MSRVSDTHAIQVDFEKLADNGGYKLGSARTLYNGARRKLFKLYGDNVKGQADETDGAPSPVKKARKSTAGRKRKQDAADTTAFETVAKEEVDQNVFIKGEFDEE